MPVTPRQLMSAAETDLAGGNHETDWRSVASRAYYAAYHGCREVAEHAKLDVSQRGSVHAALSDALVAPSNPTALRSLGFMLTQPRRWRVDADYRIDLPFTKAEAALSVETCKQILDKADAISA